MKSISFTIKVITPTLMGGGFGQNDGIRPSEIKGMMRYWFRAVAGSVVGDNLEALKKLENQIFGSQDRKSPFRIIIEKEKINYICPTDEEYPSDKLGGLIYLGIGNVIFKYSHKIRKNNKNIYIFKLNDEKISMIAPNSEFKVKFLFRNFIQEETIKLAAYSFYLATALGGFGLRSRRGFGSWQIIDVNLDDIDIKEDELKNYKKEKIEEIIERSIRYMGDKLNGNTKLNFTNFINYKFEQITTDKEEWKTLLNGLGAYYRYFRINPLATSLNKDDFKPKHTKDYNEILDRRKRNKELFNPIFGLNIQYNSSSRRGFKVSVRLQRIKNGKLEVLRRASPMFISIKEIDNNLAINLFVSISQYFKERDQSVKIKLKSNEFPAEVINVQNFGTIIDFIDKLKTAMGANNANQSN